MFQALKVRYDILNILQDNILNSFSYFIYVSSYWRIISLFSTFFEDIFKTILNISYRIWFIRIFILFIPCWNWYFKFIVFVWHFYVFPCIVILRFGKATYLLLFLFYFILSKRSSNSLWGSDILLFPEFININAFCLITCWVHYIVIYFFSSLFFLIQRIFYLPDLNLHFFRFITCLCLCKWYR